MFNYYLYVFTIYNKFINIDFKIYYYIIDNYVIIK